MNKASIIHVRLTDGIRRGLDRLAKDYRLTVSEIVRQAVDAYLTEECIPISAEDS